MFIQIWQTIVWLWQSCLWQIILFLIPVVLTVAKQWLDKILAFVKEAETHTDWTGTQKREFVVEQVKNEIDFSFAELPVWTFNALLEVCVSYTKTLK